jgi:hypothetical protein
MEPEGSLPCSQQAATGPDDPAHIIPYCVLKKYFNIIPHLPSGVVLSGFTTEILVCISYSPMRATCPTSLFIPDFIFLIILQAMKLLIMKFSPVSCHFF